MSVSHVTAHPSILADRASPFSLIEVLTQILSAGQGYERLIDGLIDVWGRAR